MLVAFAGTGVYPSSSPSQWRWNPCQRVCIEAMPQALEKARTNGDDYIGPVDPQRSKSLPNGDEPTP